MQTLVLLMFVTYSRIITPAALDVFCCSPNCAAVHESWPRVVELLHVTPVAAAENWGR